MHCLSIYSVCLVIVVFERLFFFFFLEIADPGLYVVGGEG